MISLMILYHFIEFLSLKSYIWISSLEVSYWSVVYIPRKQILGWGGEFIMDMYILNKNIATKALSAMTCCNIIFNLYPSDWYVWIQLNFCIWLSFVCYGILLILLLLIYLLPQLAL
jgi:hypothetical protein